MGGHSVFTVMPISERTEDLWHLGIHETCTRLGWDCTRADAITEPGFIVSQIHSQLNSADVVIGEMTERNPNVFYEIGYAHALGKTTILLARSAEDLNAFDTQGFRHFLHGGQALKVRKILEDVLPSLETGFVHEPCVPGGEIIFEWPSMDYNPPRLEWTAQGENRDKQLDKFGGQTFQRLTGVGEVLSIKNTERNWNHHPGSSILTLGWWTDQLRCGDRVLLFVDGKVDSPVRFSLCADGGWLNPQAKDLWVCSWKQVNLQVQRTFRWDTWLFETVVAPTSDEYDPAKRGTTVYLMSKVGAGKAEIRRIRLIRARR